MYIIIICFSFFVGRAQKDVFGCFRKVVVSDSRIGLKAGSDVIVVCRVDENDDDCEFDDFDDDHGDTNQFYQNEVDLHTERGVTSHGDYGSEHESWDAPEDADPHNGQFDDSESDTSSSVPVHQIQFLNVNAIDPKTWYSYTPGCFVKCSRCRGYIYIRKQQSSSPDVKCYQQQHPLSPDTCPECFSEYFRDTLRLQRGVHTCNTVEGQFDTV